MGKIKRLFGGWEYQMEKNPSPVHLFPSRLQMQAPQSTKYMTSRYLPVLVTLLVTSLMASLPASAVGKKRDSLLQYGGDVGLSNQFIYRGGQISKDFVTATGRGGLGFSIPVVNLRARYTAQASWSQSQSFLQHDLGLSINPFGWYMEVGYAQNFLPNYRPTVPETEGTPPEGSEGAATAQSSDFARFARGGTFPGHQGIYTSFHHRQGVAWDEVRVGIGARITSLVALQGRVSIILDTFSRGKNLTFDGAVRSFSSNPVYYQLEAQLPLVGYVGLGYYGGSNRTDVTIRTTLPPLGAVRLELQYNHVVESGKKFEQAIQETYKNGALSVTARFQF